MKQNGKKILKKLNELPKKRTKKQGILTPEKSHEIGIIENTRIILNVKQPIKEEYCSTLINFKLNKNNNIINNLIFTG